MGIENAVSIVKGRYKGNLVLSGFEYKDMYLFNLVFGMEQMKNTQGSICVFVDKETGRTGIYNYLGEMFKHTAELSQAERSRVWIDVGEPVRS